LLRCSYLSPSKRQACHLWNTVPRQKGCCKSETRSCN